MFNNLKAWLMLIYALKLMFDPLIAIGLTCTEQLQLPL